MDVADFLILNLRRRTRCVVHARAVRAVVLVRPTEDHPSAIRRPEKGEPVSVAVIIVWNLVQPDDLRRHARHVGSVNTEGVALPIHGIVVLEPYPRTLAVDLERLTIVDVVRRGHRVKLLPGGRVDVADHVMGPAHKEHARPVIVQPRPTRIVPLHKGRRDLAEVAAVPVDQEEVAPVRLPGLFSDRPERDRPPVAAHVKPVDAVPPVVVVEVRLREDHVQRLGVLDLDGVVGGPSGSGRQQPRDQ